MVCSETQGPRQLDLDGPTIPDHRPTKSRPLTVHEVSGVRELFILRTITACRQYTGFVLQDDQQLPDAERLPREWRDPLSEGGDSSGYSLIPPESELFQTSGEQPAYCSTATSHCTGEDAQSSCPETVQETEAVMDTDHRDYSIHWKLDSVCINSVGKEPFYHCISIVKERNVSEKEEKKFYLKRFRQLLHHLSGKYRGLSLKLKRELEIMDAKCVWLVETPRFTSVIDQVLQQAENGEQALQSGACDLLPNHRIRELAREFDSVPIAEATVNISFVLAPLLGSTLMLLLLTLANLRRRYKLLLFDLDVTHSLKLLVHELVGLLRSSARLLRLLRKPMKSNSSETIMMISITLSCWVEVTNSAPPHPPNLLVRMVEGEGGTFHVPLLGSPNTGYCANIIIGVQHPQEVLE